MARVFLSYSRDDQDLMNAVKTALTKGGSSVWTDDTLEPGTAVWQRTIEQQISDASCLVVLLSPSAKASHWVRAEITRARFEQKDVVPVLVRGGREADIVPFGLENTNWIDIRRNRAAGLARLVDTIARVSGGAGASATSSAEPQVSSAADEGELTDAYQWQNIGQVLRYYPNVDAAGVELTGPIRLGDLLFLGHGNNGVLQRVESIERNRVRVPQAGAGDQVGIRVWAGVEPGHGVERAMNAERAACVGSVARFYSNLSVAGIHLESPLATGDRIEIRGPETRFKQTVRSLEQNRQRVNRAAGGDSIGLAVILPAKAGDRVYRLQGQ